VVAGGDGGLMVRQPSSEEGRMPSPTLLDNCGRRRSPATLAGFPQAARRGHGYRCEMQWPPGHLTVLKEEDQQRLLEIIQAASRA
jgi:hypothetical protein